MYIFLSRDKKKLCARSSMIGMSINIKYKVIPDTWKSEIFGDYWSISIKELAEKFKNIIEIKELIETIPYREAVISKPEFVETRSCDRCGVLLNEIGTCPVCDEGEEDYF